MAESNFLSYKEERADYIMLDISVDNSEINLIIITIIK